MALHGVVRINGESIIGYKVVRSSLNKFPVEDTICDYTWEVQRMIARVGYERGTVTAKGQCQHRYGDKAEILLAKVLGLAHPQLVKLEEQWVAAQEQKFREKAEKEIRDNPRIKNKEAYRG